MTYSKDDASTINAKISETSLCEEDIFSNSTLSDIENSYTFWKSDVDEGKIYELYYEFDSSEDEIEKNYIKENVHASKLYSSIEINTLPVEINTTYEEGINLSTEAEN